MIFEMGMNMDGCEFRFRRCLQLDVILKSLAKIIHPHPFLDQLLIDTYCTSITRRYWRRIQWAGNPYFSPVSIT